MCAAESLSSGEEEEEEESEEEKPAPKKQHQQAQPQKQQQQAKGAKRPAAEQPAAATAKTPQPAKRAKAEQKQAPATAPAKVAALKAVEAKAAAAAAAAAKTPAAGAKGQATPASEKDFLEALQAALRSAGGPLKMAAVRGAACEGRACGHTCRHLLPSFLSGAWPRQLRWVRLCCSLPCFALLAACLAAAGRQGEAAAAAAQDEALHREALCRVQVRQGGGCGGAGVMPGRWPGRRRCRMGAAQLRHGLVTGRLP